MHRENNVQAGAESQDNAQFEGAQTAPTEEAAQEFRQTVYQHLMELGRLQVEAEGMYHNRSSVITLALGMLAVAFVGLVNEPSSVQIISAICTSVVGFGLSVLWLLLEQRNQVYFSARGNVIEELERRVVREYKSVGFDFPVFWGRVPKDVGDIAKPIQRVSGPMITRTIIPIVFAAFWIVMGAQASLVLNSHNEQRTKLSAKEQRDSGSVSPIPNVTQPPWAAFLPSNPQSKAIINPCPNMRKVNACVERDALVPVIEQNSNAQEEEGN